MHYRLIILLLLLLISSCTINGRLRHIKSTSLTFNTSETSSPLRIGDQLTLFYSINEVLDTAQYILEPGDQIRVVVSDREDLSRIYTIAPDGNLYLPNSNRILTTQKTPGELTIAISNILKKITQDASILISFERFNSGAKDLINILSPQNGQGPIFRATVNSDFTVSLPVIGKLDCRNLTFNSFFDTLTNLYHKKYSTLQVIPVFENSSFNTVTILGEVNKPGAFNISGRITLATILGLANGWKNSALLQSIIVIQRTEMSISIQRINFLDDLVTASQMSLSAGDIVFVPSTPITNLDNFVDEYIRKVLPFNIGVSVPLPLN